MKHLVLVLLAASACTKEREKAPPVPVRENAPSTASSPHDQMVPPVPTETVVPGLQKECDGGQLALLVDDRGLSLASAKGPEGRCFGARTGDALDLAWLAAELAPFARRGCAPGVVLSASDKRSYAEMIQVIDALKTAGLTDVAVTAVDKLPVAFDATATSGQHCPASVLESPPRDPAQPKPSVLPSSADVAKIEEAPSVMITKDELRLRGVAVGKLSALEASIAALVKALPAQPKQPYVILQADQATSMRVVTQLIEALKAAGYTNVMFAVKAK